MSSTQLVGRFESLGVYNTMSQKKRPTGHLQVKTDKNGRGRSFWAFWRDRNDKKGGRRLGPAHIRDSGRRTARGAVIWRAGHGPKPSPEHLTPKEAQACLETIIEELRATAEVEHVAEHTLQQAVEGWLAERKGERGLKRSTIAGYEDMFERLFRDLGADTQLRSLADGRLHRVLSETKARQALAALTEAQSFRDCAAVRQSDLASGQGDTARRTAAVGARRALVARGTVVMSGPTPS